MVVEPAGVVAVPTAAEAVPTVEPDAVALVASSDIVVLLSLKLLLLQRRLHSRASYSSSLVKLAAAAAR